MAEIALKRGGGHLVRLLRAVLERGRLHRNYRDCHYGKYMYTYSGHAVIGLYECIFIVGCTLYIPTNKGREERSQVASYGRS